MTILLLAVAIIGSCVLGAWAIAWLGWVPVKGITRRGATDERCITCRFWDHWEPNEDPNYHGFVTRSCLRHAPSRGRMMDPSYRQADWPITTGDDWCGDWQQHTAQGKKDG